MSITDLAEMSSLRHDRNDSVSDDDLAGSLHRFIILDTSDHHDDGADMLHEFSLICSPWGRYRARKGVVDVYDFGIGKRASSSAIASNSSSPWLS